MSDFTLFTNPINPTTEPLPDLDALAQEFQASDWSITEAFMCLILAAAFADHNLAEEERDEIAALVKRSRTMKRLTSQELASVNKTVNERMKDRPDYLREACQAMPTDMRLAVFAHCVDITLADGQLLAAEADFLNNISELMALNETRAQEVMRVMMYKNRY